MDERKFIRLKKEEFGIKEYIKRDLGKGKISKLDIEYTPVGEKIIVSTSKPGLVIGKRGEKIEYLTRVLKTRFKLENPHIEIKEIEKPLFDAQIVADDIALALERMGNLKFKVIAYRKLQEIINEGALGCEIRLTGKLPSERARSWRFAEGYLKKAGEPSKEIDRAKATALTKTGIIGVKVAIMPPGARIYDRIEIDDDLKNKIKGVVESKEESEEEKDSEEKQEKPKKKHKKKKEEDKKITKKEEKEIQEDIKEIEDSQEVPPERDGTAMKIEEEIEEGVPQETIDEEIKEDIEKAEEIKEGTDNIKKDKANQASESDSSSKNLKEINSQTEEQKDNKPKNASKEEGK